MLPPVHLAVGYLCYAAVVRLSNGDAPAGRTTLVAVLAAALPDLIDKPLNWLGVVDVGRTLGHSLLFVVPLVVLVWVLARRADERELGIAFATGSLSHVATDVPWHLLSGEYHELGFLLWPITPMPPYTGTTTLATLGGTEVSTLWLEAAILVAGVALWVRDGRPGVGSTREEASPDRPR